MYAAQRHTRQISTGLPAFLTRNRIQMLNSAEVYRTSVIGTSTRSVFKQFPASRAHQRQLGE